MPQAARGPHRLLVSFLLHTNPCGKLLRQGLATDLYRERGPLTDCRRLYDGLCAASNSLFSP